MKGLKRSHVFVHHHIVNRCKGGTRAKTNLIRLDEAREKAFHFLFHNLSFQEAAQLLLRADRMIKNRKH